MALVISTLTAVWGKHVHTDEWEERDVHSAEFVAGIRLKNHGLRTDVE
jgi:hypothetical protein